MHPVRVLIRVGELIDPRLEASYHVAGAHADDSDFAIVLSVIQHLSRLHVDFVLIVAHRLDHLVFIVARAFVC